MREKSGKSWSKYGADPRLNTLSQDLMDFLTENKTEREIVRTTCASLKKAGARSVTDCSGVCAGDIVYMNWKNRAVAVARIGKKSVAEGVNVIISHGDAPRIDIKERPLYEKEDLAFFDCHYYGGIKKYQWVNIPLALHGELYDGSGNTQFLALGEKKEDPVFTIPDLAIHVDSEMSKRTAKEAVDGENLDTLVGSETSPQNDEAHEHISIESLKKLLSRQWGLDEKKLVSADLTFVPAGPARELGFDRSLIGSYALDDHICAAASWFAFLQSEKIPERTVIHMVMDKEEIGSDGVAGADGALFELFMLELLRAENEPVDALTLRRSIAGTLAVSADVTAGCNPLYESSYVRDQQPLCGNGVVIMKSSGSGGKYEASEARGEMMSAVVNVLDAQSVPWQVGSFGRIDKAGGGTLAKYIARLGADIIDIGPALLSMHSPFEIASKADFVALTDCYTAFFNNMKAL